MSLRSDRSGTLNKHPYLGEFCMSLTDFNECSSYRISPDTLIMYHSAFIVYRTGYLYRNAVWQNILLVFPLSPMSAIPSQFRLWLPWYERKLTCSHHSCDNTVQMERVVWISESFIFRKLRRPCRPLPNKILFCQFFHLSFEISGADIVPLTLSP